MKIKRRNDHFLCRLQTGGILTLSLIDEGWPCGPRCVYMATVHYSGPFIAEVCPMMIGRGEFELRVCDGNKDGVGYVLEDWDGTKIGEVVDDLQAYLRSRP